MDMEPMSENLLFIVMAGNMMLISINYLYYRKFIDDFFTTLAHVSLLLHVPLLDAIVPHEQHSKLCSLVHRVFRNDRMRIANCQPRISRSDRQGEAHLQTQVTSRICERRKSRQRNILGNTILEKLYKCNRLGTFSERCRLNAYRHWPIAHKLAVIYGTKTTQASNRKLRIFVQKIQNWFTDKIVNNYEKRKVISESDRQPQRWTNTSNYVYKLPQK
ncbi:unnamed protein product [Nesidiocoris tenuis]|uniref:Uncharacterized protein n=1 Tax=Nesidiocoris tenuis TaxID=355587 RepID=A0A6H5G5J7_9HEMI|nr:unnamed protein product [Nesidiocoris tenuis]